MSSIPFWVPCSNPSTSRFDHPELDAHSNPCAAQRPPHNTRWQVAAGGVTNRAGKFSPYRLSDPSGMGATHNLSI